MRDAYDNGKFRLGELDGGGGIGGGGGVRVGCRGGDI